MDYSTMYLCMYLKNQILRIISEVMIDKGAIVNLLIPSMEKKYMPSTIRKYIDDFFTQLKIHLITILQSHM